MGQKTAKLVQKDRYEELIAANLATQEAVVATEQPDSPEIAKAVKRFAVASIRYEEAVTHLLRG